MADDGTDIFEQFRQGSTDTSAAKKPVADGATDGNPAAGGDIFQQFRAADAATKATTPLPGPGVPSPDEQSADTGLPLPGSPPSSDQVKTLLGLANQPSQDQLAAIRSQTPVERILQAGREGAVGAPDASGWAPGGLQLGRYLVDPLLEAGGAIFRGGQQFAQEATPDISLPSLPPGVSIPLGGGRSISGQLTPGSLGREVAASPEAFPTGDYGQPGAPRSVIDARNVLNRPVQLDEVTAAIRRADAAAAADHPLSPPQPPPSGAAGPQPGAATAQPQGQFLNGQWLRNAGATGQGFDMGKGGAALTSQVSDALARGDTVQLVTDGGNKTVGITGINQQGMMVDAQGQPWGSAPFAFDGTGREGLRITPSATPASAVPGAQPAGAAVTPPGMATISPQEAAAYRSTAEGSKLLENQRVGEPDRTSYIPDVTPNSVEQEQTVTAARELKSLGVTSPEASAEAKLAAQANNDARTSYWQDTAGSPVDIQKAEAARDAQAQADLKATWANKTEADAQPVIDTANAIKASPDGRRPAVRSAVDSITSELTDANGNLITDPEQLYGVRKHIDDLLSPAGQRETPLAARATASLQALKDSLDTTIEAAAPGFKDYLKNFSDASKPIDEMNVLHDAEPGLFKGPGSTMRYSDFQRFMKNVVDMRQAQGVNPYKSISDDTMTRLWNLRDDLRRSASAQELARAPGSDTMPNIIDAMKQYGKLGGGMAIDAAVSHMFPGVGPVAMRGIRAMLAPITAQRVARQQIGRVREMLYPQNPLTPPPSDNPLQPP